MLPHPFSSRNLSRGEKKQSYCISFTYWSVCVVPLE